MAVIAAGASWLAADHFFPALLSASVTMEAEGRQAGPLSDEAAAAWRAWHSEYLQGDSFHTVLAKRMEERRMAAWAVPATLAARLQRDVRIDSSEPDSITIALAGTERDETTAVLDILATTLQAESARHWRGHADGAWAVVKGQREEGGGVHEEPARRRSEQAGEAVPEGRGPATGVIAVARR